MEITLVYRHLNTHKSYVFPSLAFSTTLSFIKAIYIFKDNTSYVCIYVRMYILTQPQSVIALYRLVAVLEIMFSNRQVHFLTFAEL